MTAADRFRPGELVNVTIKNARVEEVTERMVHLSYGDGSATGIHFRSENVTVAHIAPAEWPPQCGDIWADRNGAKYFARAGGDFGDMEMVGAYSGTGADPDYMIATYGPVTLVYRDGWSLLIRPETPAEAIAAEDPDGGR